MIHPIHLRQLIIRPTLHYLNMWSESAENLLMGTAAQESHLGHFLMQVDHLARPQGPALGIYQMEPGMTGHEDIWVNYLAFRSEIRGKIDRLCFRAEAEEMIYNLKYATAMARLKYWRDPEPLSEADDIEGLARIWKRVYNSPAGKGTVEEFVNNYARFVSGVEND